MNINKKNYITSMLRLIPKSLILVAGNYPQVFNSSRNTIGPRVRLTSRKYSCHMLASHLEDLNRAKGARLCSTVHCSTPSKVLNNFGSED